MKVFYIFPYYLSWHYTRAISHFLETFRNLLYFTFNFYSLRVLFNTLFHPFSALPKPAKINSNSEVEKEIWIVTFIMRLLGLIVRVVTIVVGLFAIFVTVIFWSIALAVWLGLPFIMIFFALSALIGFF